QHAGIHDAHVHSGSDGVIEECRVDSLAHLIVASEAERNVGDATAHLRVWQVLLDPARRANVVHRVVAVLLHTGGNSEDIWIKDAVFWLKANVVHQYPVGALANADLVFVSGSLALLVEGHHFCSRTVFLNGSRMLAKVIFALLQRDGVNDALALHAF